MNNLIKFPTLDDMAIEIKRTDDFKASANDLSDFLAELPLTHEDNDKLVSLMIKQVNVAETSAFTQGFAMGYELAEVEVDKS